MYCQQSSGQTVCRSAHFCILNSLAHHPPGFPLIYTSATTAAIAIKMTTGIETASSIFWTLFRTLGVFFLCRSTIDGWDDIPGVILLFLLRIFIFNYTKSLLTLEISNS